MTTLFPSLSKSRIRVYYRDARPDTPGECTRRDVLTYLAEVPEAVRTLRYITTAHDDGMIQSRHGVERRPGGDGPAAERDHVDTLIAYGLVEDHGRPRHAMLCPTDAGRDALANLSLQALLP